MQKLIQTKLVTTHENGNCYPTVIACMLDLKPEDVVSFENLYFLKTQKMKNINKVYKQWYLNNKEEKEASESEQSNYNHNISIAMNLWDIVLKAFLAAHGYRQYFIMKDEIDEWVKNNPDKFYCVSGNSSRGVQHITIYQNGKLYHDPHPSQEGLVSGTEYSYEYYEKVI